MSICVIYEIFEVRGKGIDYFFYIMKKVLPWPVSKKKSCGMGSCQSNESFCIFAWFYHGLGVAYDVVSIMVEMWPS